MNRPQVYREVGIPETWDEWPDDAKVNYPCTVMDRDQLLSLVGELGGVPEDEIGEQSFFKSGLAQLVVTLQNGTRADPKGMESDEE